MKKILLVLFALSIFRTECSAQTVSGQMAGHDYVDLGLPSGTVWATYNVGATKPEGNMGTTSHGEKLSRRKTTT